MKKLAVIAFNLGGPDSLDAVEPFLFNLFNDRAIIDYPNPFRWALAKLISKKRTPVAQEIYGHMGGRSPIVDITNAQAQALQTQLGSDLDGVETRVFVSMRYWHPFSAEIALDVKAFAPDQVVLLPLYPQFSTTTTQSSFADWDQTAAAAGLDVPTKRVCCYPTEPGFIKAQAQLLKAAMKQAADQAGENVRVLFSAHGLPKHIVEGKHDPYPDHVARGAQAVVDELASQGQVLDDWLVCYQSRVGRLEWISPFTEDEIKRAAHDGKSLVVLPLAFVSEHSETLVELDIEYAELARDEGIETYVRVPAVGVHADFIAGLANVVQGASASDAEFCPQGDEERLCAAFDRACPARMIR